MKAMFEILERAAGDGLEESMNKSMKEDKTNLVFRENDHCHYEGVEHFLVWGADVVVLDLSVTK